MPYKSEYTHQKIPRELDKRVKLSLEDHKLIREEYKNSSWGVSRRLIQFILDPKKKERDLELRKLRGGSMSYYDKKKQVESSQRTRVKRRELSKQGLLI